MQQLNAFVYFVSSLSLSPVLSGEEGPTIEELGPYRVRGFLL